jgi:hypothetical protein
MNDSLTFNEQDSRSVQPEKVEEKKEKYDDTPFKDAYIKGIMSAEATLDVKNKEKLLENFIKCIFDDILIQNKDKIRTNDNILKLNLGVIENAIKNTKLSNFNFDVGRIGAIIEGYAKVIESKTSK